MIENNTNSDEKYVVFTRIFSYHLLCVFVFEQVH